MAWTDEEKKEIIEKYLEADPTPENSMDIVTELAEEYKKSVNGVRMILSKAEVYVKKAPAASTPKEGNGGGSKRVSKQAAQEQLTAALNDAGVEVDEDIVSKLTGKAAIYFAEALAKVSG